MDAVGRGWVRGQEADEEVICQPWLLRPPAPRCALLEDSHSMKQVSTASVIRKVLDTGSINLTSEAPLWVELRDIVCL